MKTGDFIWAFILAAIAVFLYIPETRDAFEKTTSAHPFAMSFIKFSILATMGELLGRRIVTGGWQLKGIRCHERAFVWGMLGILFAFVFPIYSAGVDFLITKNMLPVFGKGYPLVVSSAFWKSFWMNMLFAFPMMVFHRVTDMLIDRGKLFVKWPFMQVWSEIDWKNMWGIVAPSVIWFWIPAHTVTFCLPSAYRILMAAGLSICLGGILAFAKRKAQGISAT